MSAAVADRTKIHVGRSVVFRRVYTRRRTTVQRFGRKKNCLQWRRRSPVAAAGILYTHRRTGSPQSCTRTRRRRPRGSYIIPVAEQHTFVPTWWKYFMNIMNVWFARLYVRTTAVYKTNNNKNNNSSSTHIHVACVRVRLLVRGRGGLGETLGRRLVVV